MTFETSRVDLSALEADVRAMRVELDASLSGQDLAHLKKLQRWGRAATLIGWATAWLPLPLAALALALGRSTRWLLMHHVGHRGYDQVPGAPDRLKSKGFAVGARRFLDWADWIDPEAWKYEHNVLHHSYTGEPIDPDLLERNTEALREWKAPRPLKLLAIAGLAFTWRATYYAPNTLRVLRARPKKSGEVSRPASLSGELLRELWLKSYLPYMALQFVLFPALFLLIGPWAALCALLNSVAAELLSNLHTFFVVGPNHTGGDLYRFEDSPKNLGERYLRQVLGSANYRTGGDLNDFLHLWLNYQIEHHLWPDLPMTQYQAVQPKVRALCEKHGIPYVQEPVSTRFARMVRVMLGDEQMLRLPASAAPEASQAAA